MNLIRYNPNRWFDTAFDRTFADFFAPWRAPQAEAAEVTEAEWAPRVDIREKGDAIVLQAEVPGVDRESLHLETKDGVLTLKGEKHREHREEKEGVYRAERVYGAFVRQFALPEEVDGDKIDAVYKDGVLTITLPKKPEAAPKRIEVKAKDANGAKQIGTH
jgi:HSP20 family protein